MFKIGLTGGIGSGKTRVADLLQSWGVCVIDTDAIAHGLTAAEGAAMPALVEHFGLVAVRADGAMDRDWMRARVFSDPDAKQRLESILHPLISSETERLAAAGKGPYLVFVVPLLVESGRWAARVDRVCVVDCEPEVQVARVQSRSGLTPETIGRIMAAQADRNSRLAAADDVIFNGAGVSYDQLELAVSERHHQWLVQAGESGAKA